MIVHNFHCQSVKLFWSVILEISQFVNFANNALEITKMSLGYVEESFFQVMVKCSLYCQ
jgi:hypothetical protein